MVRRSLQLLVLLLAGSLLACGGGGDDDDDDDDDDTAVVDGGGDDDDDDDDVTIDAGAGPELPICVLTCNAPADCVIGPGTLNDADNYACEDDRCVWLGCNSTQECTETIGPGYTCGTVTGQTLASCYPACDTVADCIDEASPLLDEDNYVCDDGKCRYTGCASTQECIDAYQTPDWRCVAPPGSTLAGCFETCDTAATCGIDSPPYGPDNYGCDDGYCAWTGCNSTSECQSLGDYVCE